MASAADDLGAGVRGVEEGPSGLVSTARAGDDEDALLREHQPGGLTVLHEAGDLRAAKRRPHETRVEDSLTVVQASRECLGGAGADPGLVHARDAVAGR